MNINTIIVKNTLTWIWNTDWATFAKVVFDVDVNTAPDHKLEYLKKFNEARITNPADLFAMLDYKKMDKITTAASERYGSSADDLHAQVKRLREEVMRYHRCLQNLYDKELIDDDNDHFDEVRELLEEGDD